MPAVTPSRWAPEKIFSASSRDLRPKLKRKRGSQHKRRQPKGRTNGCAELASVLVDAFPLAPSPPQLFDCCEHATPCHPGRMRHALSASLWLRRGKAKNSFDLVRTFATHVVSTTL